MSEIEESVDPDDARELLGSGRARAIDLRDEKEAGDGHAPGAVIVGDRSLKEATEEALKIRKVPVLVFCEDGKRSSEAAAKLRDEGIEAASVEGGWSNWAESGMPVQPGSDKEYEGPKLPTPGT